MTGRGYPCIGVRVARCFSAAVLVFHCGASVPSVLATCVPTGEEPPPKGYSREDVAAGRQPDTAALDRVLLRIGDKRVNAAVVTDAARDHLDDSWPGFLPHSRLMLVDLDTGRPIREWVQSPHAASHETHAGDPRLSAALGAAAVLQGPDGLARRLYAGDAGGRVWRMDLPPLSKAEDAKTHWQLALLADLSPPAPAGSIQFRVAPDIVRSADSRGTPFDGVLITSEGAASGESGDVGNGLFFLRDYSVQVRRPGDVSPALITWSDLAPSIPPTPSRTGTGAGWFAPFRNGSEVARHRPLADDGRVFLVTASPAATCDEAALALTYVFNLTDGRPYKETVAGSVAGVGRLGGPLIEGRDIVLPGLGVALHRPAEGDDERYQARFTAEGIFVRIAYWRDLLLDAE